MLLRSEDLSSISGLTLANAFMIGDQIVCVSNNLVRDWKMYQMDSETFTVKELHVDFHDVPADCQTCIQCPVVVHNGKAYAWAVSELKFIEGEMEGDSFHWKMMPTPEPPVETEGWTRYSEGTTSTFTIIVSDDIFDGTQSSIFQFDLSSKIWSHRHVLSNSIRSQNASNKYIWTLKGKVHIITKNGMHLVSDCEMDNWTFVCKNDKSCVECRVPKHFVHNQDLFKFYSDESDNVALYRFDCTSYNWIKVSGIVKGMSEYICPCDSDVVVCGTRVFLFQSTGRDHLELRQLRVFELAPTLFDRAQSVVLKNAKLKRIGEQVLPNSLRTTLSRDTSGDARIPMKLRTLEANPTY